MGSRYGPSLDALSVVLVTWSETADQETVSKNVTADQESVSKNVIPIR